MIRLYKGNLITISKSVNGRGSFKVEVTIYYRYTMFKVRKYKNTVVLDSSTTLRDTYEATKVVIDELDRMVKL